MTAIALVVRSVIPSFTLASSQLAQMILIAQLMNSASLLKELASASNAQWILIALKLRYAISTFTYAYPHHAHPMLTVVVELAKIPLDCVFLLL